MRLLGVIILLFANAAAANGPGEKIYEYFEVFSAQDAVAIADSIYAPPVLVGGGDTHRVIADRQAVIDGMKSTFEQFTAIGWTKSVISDVKVCELTDTLALVDTHFSRLDKDGNPIPPEMRTTLYVVQKFEEGWRIIAFYGHDVENRPGC